MTVPASDEPVEERGPTIRPHEKVFWRRLAHWGASRGPWWFVRYAPPLVGWGAALLVPSARRAVLRNLRRVRGPATPLRDAKEVLATFANYATCLTEVLSNDAGDGPHLPRITVEGRSFVRDVMARRAAGSKPLGLVIVTAHTAGWESVGPLLAQDYGLALTLVMSAEGDARSREIHDRARRKAGLGISHVGDPLASLPLLRELRAGAAVALQLDRTIPGLRTRDVTLLGQRDRLPEGPLRLAQLTGAPILPIFCARQGHRSYVVRVYPSLTIDRHASDDDLEAAAQELADDMTDFLRDHPTDWFHFVG